MNLYRKKERFLSDLKNKPLSLVFSKWLLDRTPFIFEGERIKGLEWKERLAKELDVDSHAISIIGGAALGFSLNPNKNFKIYDGNSDIDLAIISYHHFEIGWNFLRNLGTEYYKLDYKQKAIVEDHRKRLIYWGTIATDKILPIFPFGKKWYSCLSTASQQHPANNRDINVRIYRDYDSLRAYHVMNLQNTLQKLYEEP